jgi:hypothetical protein
MYVLLPRESSHRPLDVYGFHKLDIYKSAKTYKKHSFWNHYRHFFANFAL